MFAVGLSFALTWVVVAAGREAGPARPDTGRATCPLAAESVAPASEPNHPPGTIVRHEPNEETGFTWFSYVPTSVMTDNLNYIVVNATHGQAGCDQAEAEANTLRHMECMTQYAEDYRLVLLYAAICKKCGGDWDEWTLHFPDYVFTDPPDSIHYRPDLKVNAMIDNLTAELREDGFRVNDEVFAFGFSIGGTFAIRYTLLQPDQVAAYAAGGTHVVTLPESPYEGYPFDWPLGVADYEALAGKPFAIDLYKDKSILIFWGEQEDAPFGPGQSCDAGDMVYCEWVDTWGGDPSVALGNQCAFLQDRGYSAECQEYPGVGHTWTEEMRENMFFFFSLNRDEAEFLWPGIVRVSLRSGETGPDGDSDGLIDRIEELVGTDPTDDDTDHDGLSDREEYGAVTDGRSGEYGLGPPLIADPAGDSHTTADGTDIAGLYASGFKDENGAGWLYLILEVADGVYNPDAWYEVHLSTDEDSYQYRFDDGDSYLWHQEGNHHVDISGRRVRAGFREQLEVLIPLDLLDSPATIGMVGRTRYGEQPDPSWGLKEVDKTPWAPASTKARIFATDPLGADTDGDGVSDGLELQLGSDPTDNTDVICPIYLPLVIR